MDEKRVFGVLCTTVEAFRPEQKLHKNSDFMQPRLHKINRLKENYKIYTNVGFKFLP